MKKLLIGLIVGAVCGAIDGATAWFTPAVRPEILTIVFLSTIKGVIVGIAAGLFAWKVKSVPAGIVFGLAVGCLLAYLVAKNPDPKTGEHYWWQIMVPGTVFGAVIGWATQHYARQARAAVAAAMLIAFIAMPMRAGEPMKAADAFQALKGLAGKWSGSMMTPDGPAGSEEYRVTACGSAVMLVQFPQSEHEMITMFTIDGNDLIATHYCSGQNQPTMKLNPAKSTPNDLVFDFVHLSGAQRDFYIHDAHIKIAGDKLEETWNSNRDVKRMFLARVK